MWRRLFSLPLKRGCTILNGFNCTNLKTGASALLMLNTAHVFNLEANMDEDSSLHLDNPFPFFSEDELLNYNCELHNVGKKNNEAMRNLIKTLNSCIKEICEQYQHCVMKQIEITLTCMNLEPVGQHWDELTKYRVEADDLKNEFLKYSMLVERIGQIIYAYNCTVESNDGSIEDVASDFEQLKDLIQQKAEENHYWDGKLLDVNAESILIGTH